MSNTFETYAEAEREFWAQHSYDVRHRQPSSDGRIQAWGADFGWYTLPGVKGNPLKGRNAREAEERAVAMGRGKRRRR